VETGPDENARKIVAYLEERGFLLPDGFSEKAQEEEAAEPAAA
jgi:hypothetical protein